MDTNDDNDHPNQALIDRILQVGGKIAFEEYDQEHPAREEPIDLVKANLEACNFRGAVLRRVNFTEADLTAADFIDAKLEAVNMERAGLYDVHFDHASLVGCNLRGAQLNRALLDGTNLEDADIHQSDCTDVKFGRALNLGKVRGIPRKISRAGLAILRAHQDEEITFIDDYDD